MEAQSRRNLLKNAAKVAAAAATVSAGSAVVAKSAPAQMEKPTKKAYPAAGAVVNPAAPPKPYSPAISFGNLLFLSGIGSAIKGTIEEQTKWVLDEIEKNLIADGSSMDKVLKVTVFLADIGDWAKMNSVYMGRFGKVPPVRTTVATANGIVGGALIEVDCIAYI